MFNNKDNDEDNIDPQGGDKEYKVEVVFSTNAIINPRTMMIKNQYTSVADFTMLAPIWLKHFTVGTYSIRTISLQQLQQT